MNKTGAVPVKGNQWQRLFRWHQGQKVSEEGEDGVKEEEKRDTSLVQRFKIK